MAIFHSYVSLPEGTVNPAINQNVRNHLFNPQSDSKEQSFSISGSTRQTTRGQEFGHKIGETCVNKLGFHLVKWGLLIYKTFGQ